MTRKLSFYFLVRITLRKGERTYGDCYTYLYDEGFQGSARTEQNGNKITDIPRDYRKAINHTRQQLTHRQNFISMGDDEEYDLRFNVLLTFVCYNKSMDRLAC